MAKKNGGIPTVKALIEAGVDFTLYPHEHGDGETSFGAEVVRKLEVEAEADRVFKTLVADLGGELVVGIVPVPRQLDLKALAAALGAKKATLAASPDEAACSTGTSSAASPRSVSGPRCGPCSTNPRTASTRSSSRPACAASRSRSPPADLRGLTGATSARIATLWSPPSARRERARSLISSRFSDRGRPRGRG